MIVFYLDICLVVDAQKPDGHAPCQQMRKEAPRDERQRGLPAQYKGQHAAGHVREGLEHALLPRPRIVDQFTSKVNSMVETRTSDSLDDAVAASLLVLAKSFTHDSAQRQAPAASLMDLADAAAQTTEGTAMGKELLDDYSSWLHAKVAAGTAGKYLKHVDRTLFKTFEKLISSSTGSVNVPVLPNKVAGCRFVRDPGAAIAEALSHKKGDKRSNAWSSFVEYVNEEGSATEQSSSANTLAIGQALTTDFIQWLTGRKGLSRDAARRYCAAVAELMGATTMMQPLLNKGEGKAWVQAHRAAAEKRLLHQPSDTHTRAGFVHFLSYLNDGKEEKKWGGEEEKEKEEEGGVGATGTDTKEEDMGAASDAKDAAGSEDVEEEEADVAQGTWEEDEEVMFLTRIPPGAERRGRRSPEGV